MTPPLPSTRTLEPRLAVIHAVDPGQGKTMVVQDVVSWLRSTGHQVGGFSVRRAYRATDVVSPAAFYAHLYSTDEHVRLSHDQLRADEAIDLELYRNSLVRPALQNLSDAAVRRVVNQALADHANPHIDTLVLDELGPNLAATVLRKNRRSELLPQLVEQALEHPKPLTIIVAPTKKGFLDANRAEAVLQAAIPLFGGRVLVYDLNAHSLPMLAAAIVRDLASE